MSQLSEWRTRIKVLLASSTVEEDLVLEGIEPVRAKAIADSKAVIAQRSLSHICPPKTT